MSRDAIDGRVVYMYGRREGPKRSFAALFKGPNRVPS
jgi:hypothetical protein